MARCPLVAVFVALYARHKCSRRNIRGKPNSHELVWSGVQRLRTKQQYRAGHALENMLNISYHSVRQVIKVIRFFISCLPSLGCSVRQFGSFNIMFRCCRYKAPHRRRDVRDELYEWYSATFWLAPALGYTTVLVIFWCFQTRLLLHTTKILRLRAIFGPCAIAALLTVVVQSQALQASTKELELQEISPHI